MAASDSISYIFNHLFLPPKLPQEDDRGIDRQKALLSHVAESADAFYQAVNRAEIDQDVRQCWETLHRMISSMQDLRQGSLINLPSLLSVVENMRTGDILCLLISKQNAGIILRKFETKKITLEFFPASATAEAVTGCRGKLIIQFPSRPRLSIPNKPLLIESLCTYLVAMDCTEMPDAVPVTMKAGSEQGECREVPDIRYISELLGGIARAVTPDVDDVASSTEYIEKRINDHVLWQDGLNPWRRDPQWLVLRVALQTSLAESMIDDRYGYKIFITYVLARALEKACNAELGHELLYTMNVKIATRIWKIKSLVHPGFPFDYIINQNQLCQRLLKDQWQQIQELEARPLPWTVPKRKEIQIAEGFALTRSRAYLSAVFNRSRELLRQNDSFFPEKFEATLVNDDLRELGLSPPAPIPTGATGANVWLAILDLERWIFNNLDGWQADTDPGKQPMTLRRIIISLEGIGDSLNSPALFSRIFLIILELWVALDKAVISAIPLLKEYSPGLSIVSFEPLILPTLCQMKRLRTVENYLERRHVEALYHEYSLFTFINHPHSFASRYFQTSVELQQLQSNITSEATKLRNDKIRECLHQNEKYRQVYRENDQREHVYDEWVDRFGYPRTSHSRSCLKCHVQEDLASMRITAFEWPLPEDPILSGLVVFELQLPKPFAIWRDISYRLARHYSFDTDGSKQPRPTPILSNYPPLQGFFSGYAKQEVTIASETKSFLVSHYRECDFPCEEDAVVKNHPLQYELYHVAMGEWIPAEFPLISLREICNPKPLSGPYESLAWAVISTSHTPNMVIARQSECPIELSFHEWEAFGHIRSGKRLQWRNMMLELVKGTVALEDPTVYLLFRQAAWQVEERSDSNHRESHIDLADKTFGREAVGVLRGRLDRICDNWQQNWTATTLSMLACRLFSLSISNIVQMDVLEFLSSLRKTVEKWLDQVLELLGGQNTQVDPSEEFSIDIRHVVIQLAITCRSTFALGCNVVSDLFKDPKIISTFIKCAIVLQNNLPGSHCTLPTHLRYLVEEDTVLSVEVVDLLVRSTLSNEEGLEDAIRYIWQGFRRNSSFPWKKIGDRWIACRTSVQGGIDRACFVCLNMLDGTLLVDGKTLGNLPKSILQHPLFKSVFPSQFTMEIVPSAMKGMMYQLRRNVQNKLEIHFAMIDSDLLIRTRDVDSCELSEFVCPDRLSGDLPNALLVGTVHRFHDSSQCLQVYPALSGWDPSALPDWTMHFTTDPLVTQTSLPKLTKITSGVEVALLSPESDLLKSLADIFRPLEPNVTNLLVTWEPCQKSPCDFPLYFNRNLHISLPRYKLKFSVGARRDLECKELPGMSIASKQSFGALFGFKNKLVLESRDGIGRRKVIVPDGKVVVTPTSYHMARHPNVTIELPEAADLKIKMFIYEVDELIGRLVSDRVQMSWYMLTYLHALTSSHLSDPLTHRTGVQQALSMLKSANSFAFTHLTTKDMKFLQLIHALTPIRNYYPKDLTSMEQVKWQGALSPLSQSDLFAPLVEAIVHHGSDQVLFDLPPPKLTVTVKYRGNVPLRERAELRNCRLIPGSEMYRTVSLCDYRFSPDRCLHSNAESTEKEGIVFRTSSLVAEWTTFRNELPDIWTQFQDWSSFSTAVDPHLSFGSHNVWLLGSTSKIWFSLFSLCLSASKDKDEFGLMFALGILSYRTDIDIRLVDALRAVATNVTSQPLLRAAALLPNDHDFDLSPGHALRSKEIEGLAGIHCISFESSPQAGVVHRIGETLMDAAARRKEAYDALCKTQCQYLANDLINQWPSPVVYLPNNFATHYSLIDRIPFEEEVQNLFSSRFFNFRLFRHAEELQLSLNAIPYCQAALPTLPPKTPTLDAPSQPYEPLSLFHLVHVNERLASKNPLSLENVHATNLLSVSGLSTRKVILRLSERNSERFPSRYIADLEKCVDALETRPTLPAHSIQSAISPRTIPEDVLFSAGLWPSLGPESLLSLLSHHLRQQIHPDWKEALIGYAEGLAADQRKARIAALQKAGLEAEVANETANIGGQGWNAAEYLDWLLIQLDGNFLIRPVQASIAREMMSPRGQKNTVMQLNMGEGKSSVIVPIISAALADGDRLVRVVVLKPLYTQMFHLLKQRICGLANRRLFYLPFSRGISLKTPQVQRICGMFRACALDGGVLLCQPEHILSFQLIGLDLLCNSKDTDRANLFIQEQRWLDSKTRDILDESDEVLNVRYQLIYTLGTPGPLQGQPDRWQVIQNVFSLLKDHVKEVAMMHPGRLELQPIKPYSQCFPRTRILTHECCQELIKAIARQIVFEEKMPLTPFRSYSQEFRNLAFRFVTEYRISRAESDTLEEYSDEYFDHLLLLRGLIAHGILLLTLKEKRWRVDYGLDLTRSMLAVPYRAKDSPAPRAEFGHPDVTIVLTCLSYYYGGLSDQQLDNAFHRLFNSDNPSLRYEDWIKGSIDLPETLRNLQGLNLDDFEQKYHHIYPRLRDNKAVIDFYLSECVFSKEAKEFPYKLTANSWDLARQKTELTTGFSGTNDNSYLLPLSIHQLDSEDQQHTNAQVIEYLLRVENRTVVHTGSDITALNLLKLVAKQEPHTMVLLDVGAQVLELQNKDVAREWLKLDTHPSVEAAVYCDSRDDEFYVLSRDGHVEPLEISLYRTQLNKALVYLDEARTRGTDFKFPIGTRAAVTLGPKMAKDKLVQGCMRMRKLGSGHSVVFFASSEIHRKIQASIGVETYNQHDELKSSDILVWAICETWAQIKDNGGHWASQGLNFDDRRTAWEEYSNNSISASELANVLRETESRPLKDLYGVREHEGLFHCRVSEGGPSARQEAILAKCRQFDILLSRSSALLEEQERELAHEKEEERQVERVLARSPCKHTVHPALMAFIRSGTTSARFLSLLECLKYTSRGTDIRTTSKCFFQSNNLRATEDFSRTICHDGDLGSMDDFLRSVAWILHSNRKPDMLLFISPFEANELLPIIRSSHWTSLHLYSPRVSRQVRSLEDLSFFIVPPRDCPLLPSQTIHELNLFSGQLFLYDRPSFKEVCEMLGLHLEEIPEALEGTVDTVGFVKDNHARQTLGILNCAFEKSGVPYLSDLLRWRRKGQGYTLTHLGQILHGSDLKDTEFD